MLLTRNGSFAFAQMFDKNLNVLSISKLSKAVNITFNMPEDVRSRYAQGKVTLSCISRDNYANSWASTRISMSTINNNTGEVNCLASHFT